MVTYLELKNQWIKARKEKVEYRISVFGGIIDVIQKMAKEKKSEDFDNFVILALKKEKKSYEDVLLTCSEEDKLEINSKIEVINNLLPKVLNKEETIALIIKIASNHKEEFQKDPQMGDIMKLLKQYENINMKIAQEEVKNYLNKG